MIFKTLFFPLHRGSPVSLCMGIWGWRKMRLGKLRGVDVTFQKSDIPNLSQTPNYQFSLTTLTSTWELWHIMAIPHTVAHTLISQASIGSTMASLQCVQVSFLEMSSADEIANCSRSCKQTHRRPSVTSPKQGFDGLGQHLG